MSAKCGTYAGYNVHTKEGTEVCEACQQAQTKYQREWRRRTRKTTRTLIEIPKHKRFTDAELAAEYWRSWNNVKTGSAEARDWTEYDRAMVLHRFATTPSYDEVPA